MPVHPSVHPSVHPLDHATAAEPAPVAGNPSPDRPRRAGTARLLVRGAATGLALGAGLGVLARVWMRTVSTDPQFSWAGTLMILGLFAAAGLLVGVVRALRLASRSPWWKLLLLPGLALFAGPGMLLLPGTVVGGWGFSGRGPRALRAVCLVAALGVLPLVLWFVLVTPYERLVLEPVVVVVGFALLQGLLARGASELFLRRPAASGLAAAALPGVGVVERRG